MPLPDPSPLSSEERALARRLAELDAAAEPSAALDARVLAAARGAVTRTTARRRRWPAMAGLAASLLLAVGVAWQLRPQSPDRFVSFPQARDPGDDEAAMVILAPRAPPPRQAKRLGPAEEVPVPAAPERAPIETVASAAPAPPPPPPTPPLILDSPAPSAAPMSRAAPASPSPAPPGASSVSQPAPASAADVAANPADQDAAREADAARVAANGRGDEPEDDVPPATADSPAVRDAWLQRIQGLMDGGDIAGARASLRAFVQRYPDYTLPENLRALAR